MENEQLQFEEDTPLEATTDSFNLKDINSYITQINIADHLDKTELDKIGKKIIEWFDEDKGTRKDWEEKNDRWMKLATQVSELKTYPWPGAANVKFPLLTTAAMQFAARAYPSLVPGPRLVNGLVIGRDIDGTKAASASRVGNHMSYQVLYEMPGWEEDMDKLCLMLPISGCVFKKTYYDEFNKRNCSELISAKDLVIDYFAKSVDSAFRKSHILYFSENDIFERTQNGNWLEVDYGQRKESSLLENPTKEKIDGRRQPALSDATPDVFIECHTFWDIDDDGYKEPYIITVHYETQQVVRIVARFDSDGIIENKDGKLVKIVPTEYFTKFGFIPNPDGSIYDLGFGLLLGAINETVNTLTNQLLDAGTMSNLQAGFLGRGIRVRSGGQRFSPGEWKPVDFTGDDIKKHIFPLPVREPSDVLFKLLEALVTSGKELASVSEIFVGKMPGQNTPATTTMATIEQAMKVFTAIYKRIYRALGEEYKKLFKLNSIYTDEEVYFTLNTAEGAENQQVYAQDYSPKNITIKPNADPNIASSAQRMLKVEGIGKMLQLGTINPKVFTKQYLEALEAENIKELMNFEPPPSPEQQKIQAEMQMAQQEQQGKQQEAQMKQFMEQQKHQMNQQLEAMRAQFEKESHEMKLAFEAAKLKIKGQEAMMDSAMSAQEHQQTLAQNEQARRQTEAHAESDHNQKLVQSQEQHEIKKQQIKDTPAKPKPKK